MKVTVDAVIQRLQNVRQTTQETIETFSLWIMRHKEKDAIQTVVDGWLHCFKTASSDHQRIALFYIMNDVVQKAKNKHIDHLIPCFQPAVLQAVTIGKSSFKVKREMQRCIQIFNERRVFSSASLQSMQNILDTDGDVDGDDCIELGNDEFAKKIELFQAGQEIANKGMDVIRRADFDFAEQAKTRMRNRSEAEQLVADTQMALDQIVEFRHVMEEQKRKMYELLEMTSLAKRVYSHQQKEVAVVHDAYENFLQGVLNVKRELLDIQKTGVYPGATPPRDAPSPTANDDIYATGVESALESLRHDAIGERLLDNHDGAAMEVGDDDEDDAPLPPPPLPPPALQPIAPSAPVPGQWNVPPPAAPGMPPGFLSTIPPPGFLSSVPPPNMSSPPPTVLPTAGVPSSRSYPPPSTIDLQSSVRAVTPGQGQQQDYQQSIAHPPGASVSGSRTSVDESHQHMPSTSYGHPQSGYGTDDGSNGRNYSSGAAADERHDQDMRSFSEKRNRDHDWREGARSRDGDYRERGWDDGRNFDGGRGRPYGGYSNRGRGFDRGRRGGGYGQRHQFPNRSGGSHYQRKSFG